MKTVKDTTIRIKNHVSRNKVAYAASSVAVLAIWLQQTNIKHFTEFLEEKGINPDEYFLPEALQELNS